MKCPKCGCEMTEMEVWGGGHIIELIPWCPNGACREEKALDARTVLLMGKTGGGRGRAENVEARE